MKLLLPFFAIVFALQFNNAAADINMVAACTHTANVYPYYRDELMYEEYGNLFAEDAVFTLKGNEVVGREKIVKALKIRGPKTVTRHISNVVSMEVISDTEIRGVSYLTLYSAPLKTQKRPYTNHDESGVSSIKQPKRIAGPKLVGEYHDTFEIDENGDCKIASRRVDVIFLMDE